MGYTITPDPARARLQVALDGPGSREEWVRTIHELAGRERLPPAWSVVIDARGLTWTVRLEDVQAIRACVRVEPRPAGPVAVLSSPGAHFGAARQVAMWLQSEGLTVEAFQQELEAEAWLCAQGRRPPSEDGSRDPFPPQG
jgi:hypothetical protein